MKKKVILCPNPYRDSELKVAKDAKAILEGIGFETVVCLPFHRDGYGDELGVPVRQLQQEIKSADLMIAFGGDGTILHLSRTAALHNVPVLGINLGSLGFMSELEANELERLRDLQSWDFVVESRMMLDVTIFRNGNAVYSNIALNDAVVSKGSVARVVRLDIFTEEGRLTKVTGDGVVISTPTGSTGYSMAAGGPIVEPTARNLLITPICPHSTRATSYVLSPEHVITIEAADANRKFVYLSADGGKAFSLKNGDKVRVRQSKFAMGLVRLSKKSFCEILDYKMGGCENEKCATGKAAADHQRGSHRDAGAAFAAPERPGHPLDASHHFPGYQAASSGEGAYRAGPLSLCRVGAENEAELCRQAAHHLPRERGQRRGGPEHRGAENHRGYGAGCGLCAG